MVDEFMVVCVDRIIATAACFQQPSSSSSSAASANGGGDEGGSVSVGVVSENGESGVKKDGIFVNGEGCCSFAAVKAKGCVRECRICQEEDGEEDMEAPCACNGTLKFAHRKCIQRWCNKKGDITCEICNQVFSPNYSSPPPRINSDVMAIDIRQSWGQHIDLRDPRFLAFAAAEHQFLRQEYADALANSNTLTCFRTVAIVLMLLLLIRQTLMVTREFGMLRESSAFFNYQISVLQLAGFLLPCYVVIRSWYIVQCRRRRQG